MWTYEQVINMERYILIGKTKLSQTLGRMTRHGFGGRTEEQWNDVKWKKKMVLKMKHLYYECYHACI